MIEVKNLTFSYSHGALAVDNLSFSLHQGSRTAVIGPNGAGKSTLIRLLNGTLPGIGEIIFNGQQISPRNLKELHKFVGVVFQNPDDQLFCPTIYEDVAFGPLNMQLSKEEIDSRVKQALLIVGLEGFEHRSSFHLSYGERKLASIATVISMQPDVYIFDEPSSNLDPFHRRKIINFLNDINRTLLIATHDLDLVLDTCSHVILMDGGKLVIQGTVELLKNEGLLKEHKLELPLRFQNT